jgi:hypothetical protein
VLPDSSAFGNTPQGATITITAGKTGRRSAEIWTMTVKGSANQKRHSRKDATAWNLQVSVARAYVSGYFQREQLLAEVKEIISLVPLDATANFTGEIQVECQMGLAASVRKSWTPQVQLSAKQRLPYYRSPRRCVKVVGFQI